MNSNELKEHIRLHSLWLNGDKEGRKLVLDSSANLSSADLSSANLQKTILEGNVIVSFQFGRHTAYFLRYRPNQHWMSFLHSKILAEELHYHRQKRKLY